MPASNMPAAEVDIDTDLVRALLEEQHPDLAAADIVLLAFGWDNVVFRLGAELVVRLPRRAMGAGLIEHEQRWLPVLGPTLPLPVPAPIRVGVPSGKYPWRWSVCPWLPGTIAAVTPPDDLEETATVLGRFVAAMCRPAPADAPDNPFRGGPLADRHGPTEERCATLDGVIDGARALALWRELAETPPWTGPSMWIHGDLHPANLLVDDGRLAAVIDFGDLCAGDPATDLMGAWMLLPTELHDAFRSAAGDVDDHMWQRGRAWALYFSLAVLSTSADNPVMRGLAEATLTTVYDG